MAAVSMEINTAAWVSSADAGVNAMENTTAWGRKEAVHRAHIER
jgi:hypothetical protein